MTPIRPGDRYLRRKDLLTFRVTSLCQNWAGVNMQLERHPTLTRKPRQVTVKRSSLESERDYVRVYESGGENA